MLLPYLDARRNVSTCAGHEARTNELIDALGLSARASHRPARLSAGEQQRVALARAMVTAPSVLLADEPTSSLDTESTQSVCRLIRDACDAGMCAIVAAHDPAITDFADATYDLREGRLHRV